MSDATITHSTGTITARALAEYRAQRPPRSIAHPIINAAEVDVTFRPAGLRDGSFRLVFDVPADADDALDILCIPQTFAFASTARDGLNMSFVIVQGTAPSIEVGAAGETVVFVPFQEVPA